MEEKFTKYEKARILGARALQLSMDAPILLKIPEEKLEKLNYDCLEIADLEFSEGVLPISIKRPLPKRAKSKLKIDEKEEKEEKIKKKEEEEIADIKEEGEIMELIVSEDEAEETPESSEEGI